MKIKHMKHPRMQFKKWRSKRETRLLQQVIPSEESNVGSSYDGSSSSKQMDRPGFSIPLMTNNFRRFNARYVYMYIYVEYVLNPAESALFLSSKPPQSASFPGKHLPKHSPSLPFIPSYASTPTFSVSFLLCLSCSSYSFPPIWRDTHLPLRPLLLPPHTPSLVRHLLHLGLSNQHRRCHAISLSICAIYRTSWQTSASYTT